MFKRVTVTLLFTRDDEAEDFYHDCELAMAKATSINLGMPDQEDSYIILQQCYHDDDPSLPCKTLLSNHT